MKFCKLALVDKTFADCQLEMLAVHVHVYTLNFVSTIISRDRVAVSDTQATYGNNSSYNSITPLL